MDGSQISSSDGLYSCLDQLPGIGFTLVAQHITFGGNNHSRWYSPQLPQRSSQRRRSGFAPHSRVRHILVPEPFHEFPVERVASCELPIRRRVECSIYCRTEQDLKLDLGATTLLREHAYDGRHI